jgi:hypothetical protein
MRRRKYAATRQIVLSTHSPYFIGLAALPNGATVARVHVADEQSKISQLSSATGKAIFGLMRNENNPHIFGLLATEIFFTDDRVILTEGQEDVVFFKRVEQSVGQLQGSFFGWGVGGAENMEHVATILKELGFEKVVGILDANRADLARGLSETFPAYHFFSIPANDLRTKNPVPAKPAVAGLLDDGNRAVRPEHVEHTRALFDQANRYLRS